jgi:hypothetical protein
MKFSISFLFLFILVLTFFYDLSPQFSPEELKERTYWENFLKTADIISSENIGEGVTKPKKLLLRNAEKEAYAVWKRPSGVGAGITDKWEAEIAAYRLDKILGLNMIPPTVERTLGGRKGSLQLWIDTAISELERNKKKIQIPAEQKDSCDKATYLQRAFDSLIANTDRSQQNIRYTKDWRLILIDHSRSFRTQRFFVDQLIYGKTGMKRDMYFLQLPKEFIDKLKNLTYEKIKKATAAYLTYDERNACLQRKKMILKEVEEMIEERGEDQVLY